MKLCLACGSGLPLVRETRPTTFTYKGRVAVLDQPAMWCPKCHEGFLTRDDMRATEPQIREHQQRVDAEEAGRQGV